MASSLNEGHARTGPGAAPHLGPRLDPLLTERAASCSPRSRSPSHQALAHCPQPLCGPWAPTLGLLCGHTPAAVPFPRDPQPVPVHLSRQDVRAKRSRRPGDGSCPQPLSRAGNGLLCLHLPSPILLQQFTIPSASRISVSPRVAPGAPDSWARSRPTVTEPPGPWPENWFLPNCLGILEQTGVGATGPGAVPGRATEATMPREACAQPLS